jgi:nicotinamidase-related amidase
VKYGSFVEAGDQSDDSRRRRRAGRPAGRTTMRDPFNTATPRRTGRASTLRLLRPAGGDDAFGLAAEHRQNRDDGGDAAGDEGQRRDRALFLIAYRHGLRASEVGLPIIHTREGHRPDLADLPAAKKARGKPALAIGDRGAMGRPLVRGEPGHDIIPELCPLPGEPVVDKPGRGAFYATDLEAILRNRGIRQLIVCGVTTEVCVNTSVREANDRGYDCLVLADCVGSYFPEFHEAGLAMIKAQDGIFGWVGRSQAVIAALTEGNTR